MDEMNAWSTFLTTGSVLDYLRYKAIQEEREQNSLNRAEDSNEVCNGRSDYKGTEYR